MARLGLWFVVVAPAIVASMTSVSSSVSAQEPKPPSSRVARAPVPLDGIAAIVDDEVVFRSDLDAQVRHFEQRLSHDPIQRRAELAAMEKQLLARSIDTILIARDCRRLHLEVTDVEVTTAIDSIAKQNNLTRKRLEVEVGNAGFSTLEYQEEIRRQILEQKWVMTRASGKIERKAAPDDASFQAALDKQREALLVDLRSRAYIEVR